MIQIAACGSGVIALYIGVTGLMELAAGGSLEDALKAMAFTAASFGTWSVVGTALSAAQQAYHLTASAFFVLKTSVHGVVGGALSLAQGGSFIDGFVSNAVGAGTGLFSNAISRGNIIADTAIVAIAGGTASELTGGKFANGALTAAFANLWNKWASAWVGTDAHQTLGNHLEGQDSEWVVNSAGGGIFGGGRPDFLYRATGEIYELKPLGSEATGRSQLNNYLSGAGARYQSGSSFRIFGKNAYLTLNGSGFLHRSFGINVTYTYFPTGSRGVIGYTIASDRSALYGALNKIFSKPPVFIPFSPPSNPWNRLRPQYVR